MGELLYYAKANGNIQTLIHFNKPFFFLSIYAAIIISMSILSALVVCKVK